MYISQIINKGVFTRLEQLTGEIQVEYNTQDIDVLHTTHRPRGFLHTHWEGRKSDEEDNQMNQRHRERGREIDRRGRDREMKA